MSVELLDIHSFYLSKEFYEGKFKTVATLLLGSINDDGGVPFFVAGKEKIRTTVVATCLLALDKMKAISVNTRKKLQLKILYLKDNMDEIDLARGDVGTKKHPEDKPAWCIGETPSVWSTSYALWALFDTGYDGKEWKTIKEALMWLVGQQKADDGWAYQDFRNCKSTPFLTATALHVLRQSKKFKLKLALSKEDEEKIEKAIARGIKFILDQKKEQGKIAVWTDAVNTTWALWALFKDDPLKHSELISKGINFLREDLKGREIWEMRKFVDETGTKYGVHKTYYFFTPSLVLNLLELSVSPFDDLCLKAMEWLKTNLKPKGWVIKGYDIEEPQTFTTALALQTVSTWHKYAIEYMIHKRVVEHEEIKTDNKLRAKVKVYFGLTITCILLLCALLLYIHWSNILLFSASIPKYFMDRILPEFVATLLVLIGLTVIGWFKRNKIRNMLSLVKKKILY